MTFPSKVPVPARRRQVSAGGSLRASPQTLPSCHCWQPGAQDPTGPQAPQTTPGDQVCRLHPMQRALPLSCRDRDEGETHCCLRAWAQPLGSLGELSAALQDTGHSLPPAPSSPAGPRETGSASDLTLCLMMTERYSLTCWLKMSPLTVAPWQLVTWGQGPLGHQPMAEQDKQRFLVTQHTGGRGFVRVHSTAKGCAQGPFITFRFLQSPSWRSCMFFNIPPSEGLN